MSLDYYDVLGVERTANDAEIKKAYKKLAMKHHPDRNKGDASAEAKFKELNEAYDVLKDSSKRANYDRFGHNGPGWSTNSGPNHGGFNPHDVYRDFFSQGGPRYSKPTSGSDQQIHVELSLEEAASGIEKPFTYTIVESCEECDGTGSADKILKTCPSCNGTGGTVHQHGPMIFKGECQSCRGTGKQVTTPCKHCVGNGVINKTKNINIKIPAGVDHGNKIRLGGMGNKEEKSLPAGNLYLVILIKHHYIFERDGKDLFRTISVNVLDAIVGGEMEIQGLDKKTYTLKIPAGTNYGQMLRLKGKGMPIVNSKEVGDLNCQVHFKMPTDLTEKQINLLNEAKNM